MHRIHPTQTVGILGGMGPAAGADFARLFVGACADEMQRRGIAVTDQAFPEHWLAQVPVPDRSSALALPGAGGHQPLEPMLQAMGRLAALGARSIAVACNTAHAWHGELQQRFPQLEVLHMAQETAAALAEAGIRDIGLLATQGTYRVGLYDRALQAAGIACRIPTDLEQQRLMHGIYAGVKAGDLVLAADCFGDVASAMVARHGLQVLVLGCTELPLALKSVPGAPDVSLLDPAVVLAQALARRAYAAH